MDGLSWKFIKIDDLGGTILFGNIHKVYFQECVAAATYQYSSNPYQYEPPTNY